MGSIPLAIRWLRSNSLSYGHSCCHLPAQAYLFFLIYSHGPEQPKILPFKSLSHRDRVQVQQGWDQEPNLPSSQREYVRLLGEWIELLARLVPMELAAGYSAQDGGGKQKGKYMGSTSASAPFPLGPHSPAHSVGELSHAA